MKSKMAAKAVPTTMTYNHRITARCYNNVNKIGGTSSSYQKSYWMKLTARHC